MAQCVVCKKFLPESFMLEVDFGVKKCIFCEVGKDVVHLEEGNEPIYKEDMVSEYKNFLDGLYRKPNIREKFFRTDLIKK